MRIDPCTLDERLRSCPLVEHVDVLRDDGLHPAVTLESTASASCAAFGSALTSMSAPPVEVPHLDGIAVERIDRRVLHRVVARPDSRRRTRSRESLSVRHRRR